MRPPDIEIRLLGPVEVEVDGVRIDLRARLPRSLVVALALQPGHVVGVDALITALWDEDPPSSALGTLQSYVSTVRRALGDRQRECHLLDRRGDGYVLAVDPTAVDTLRFERLVIEARGAAPDRAEALLDEALALWRGPALADVAGETFARGPAARLDELRLTARSARIDAGLALGRHHALVPEIEALVADHPLRENLTAQLMVALYRSGRQADALRAFERTRAALVDELGISPSADLADLEGRVLRQDVDGSPLAPPLVAPTGAPRVPIVPGGTDRVDDGIPARRATDGPRRRATDRPPEGTDAAAGAGAASTFDPTDQGRDGAGRGDSSDSGDPCDSALSSTDAGRDRAAGMDQRRIARSPGGRPARDPGAELAPGPDDDAAHGSDAARPSPGGHEPPGRHAERPRADTGDRATDRRRDPSDDATPRRRRSTDAPPAPLPAIADLPLPSEAARGGRRLAPLVGRATELERIVATWTDPGPRRVLAVSGDAGIGKSRLVAELATAVHADGGLVLWGTCAEQGGSAYRPFADALRPLARTVAETEVPTLGALGPGGPHLLRLVPELAPGAHVGEQTAVGDDRGPLFDSITSVLRQTTAGRPTLLVIDDLHWADSSTCALLVHLARASDLAHVRLAVTYRSAETTHPEPAARALAELRRWRVVEQLPLAGLDADATADLVAALVADDPGDPEIDVDRIVELHDRTDGNPFFVEELVAHARDVGDEGLPVAVVDIVERRLADLDPDHRRVLAAAAVLGRAFDIARLAATVGLPEDALLDPLDAAIEHRLVTEAAPPVGQFEFAHALIRDGLLEGMTALRRSRLHLAAADAIDALGAPPELFSQRSHHLVAAGSAVPSDRLIAALHATADQALRVAAYDEAEAACSLALERMDLARGTADAVDILLVLGKVRNAIGDLPGARTVFRWAAEAARALGDGPRLGLAATGLGAGSGVGVAFELGVVDEERVAWLEGGLALLDDDADVGLRIRFLSDLAVALYDGDPVRRHEVAEEAMALARDLGDPSHLSAAYIARRTDLWTPHADLAERLEAGEQAIRHGDEGDDPLYRVVTRIAVLADLLDAAELDRFDEVQVEADDVARPLQQRRWDWFLDVSRGCRALMKGEFDDADRIIETALVDVGDAVGAIPTLTHAAARVVLDRDLGRHDRVIEFIMGLAADHVGPPPPVFVASTAVTLAEMGDTEGADALAREFLDGAVRDIPPDYLWSTTVGWFAEVAHRLGDPEAATLCASLLDGHDHRLLGLGGSAVCGVGARPRGLATLTTGDIDGAIALLESSLDDHRRLGLRPWAVRSAVDLAGALRLRAGEGDASRADALEAEATAEASALGMPLPPAPTPPPTPG